MKRLAGILIAVTWLAAVAGYWRANVPLVAAKSIQIPADAYVSPVRSPGGDLVVVPRNAGRTSYRGPVQFWRFPEGQVIRSLLTGQDEIIAGSFHSTEILVRRHGQLQIIDLETGRNITSIADRPNANGFRYLGDRRQLLIQNGPDLELFDFDAAEPRWTARGTLIFIGLVTHDLILVHLPASSGRAGLHEGVGLISLETGLPDPRFAQMGRASNIYTSRDGRLALVYAPKGERSMYDIESGRRLWTLPAVSPSYRYLYSPDASELLAYVGTRANPLEVLRWRAVDGRQLPAPSPDEARRLLAIRGLPRYVLRSERLETFVAITRWINSCNRLLSRTGARFSVDLPTVRQSIVESASSRSVGVLPGETGAMALGDGVGFVVRQKDVVHYFGLPPRRNYVWLAAWALLPPALLIGLASVNRFIARRRFMALPARPEGNGR